MALSESALTTVDALRDWLTQNALSQTDGRLADAPLEALIDRASAACAAWCDRCLVAPPAMQALRFDGDDGCRLILPDWPVAELEAVTVDGEPVPERLDVLDAGYVVRASEAWLELIGHRFTRGTQNIEVRCRLGYDPAQAGTNPRVRRALAALEQACLALSAHWFGQPAADDLPANVRAMLAPYRRLGA